MSRPDKNVDAFDCCIIEWLKRHPVRLPPGRCLGCGQPEHSHDPLLPFGTDSAGELSRLRWSRLCA
jgi:hypothetical protein